MTTINSDHISPTEPRWDADTDLQVTAFELEMGVELHKAIEELYALSVTPKRFDPAGHPRTRRGLRRGRRYRVARLRDAESAAELREAQQ